MFISSEANRTFAQHVLTPANTAQRQYEALRAFFVKGLPSKEAARRLGYSPGSFRGLVHQFRQNPRRSFFLSARTAGYQSEAPDPRRPRPALAAGPEALRKRPPQPRHEPCPG